MKKKIILGSQSDGRKKVLERLGFTFEVMPSHIDEKQIRFNNPIELTKALAHAKADALIPKIKDEALLITSDQVVVCNGVIREKPENAKEALEFLKQYWHHHAKTVTSVVITDIQTGKRLTGTDIAKIWFWHIPLEIIFDYIDTGDPFRHAGGFDHWHPMLKPFVKRIDGEEESIIGMPIQLLKSLLEKL